MDATMYRSWTNYKTWITALWLKDDELSNRYWRAEACRHVVDAPKCQEVIDGLWTADEDSRFNLAKQLKQELEKANPICDASLFADLMSDALDEINWSEVAESFLAGVAGEHPVNNTDTTAPHETTTVIHEYTPAQAIADGILVDVSEMARHAGIIFPTAMSREAWELCVAVPPTVPWQNEQGRLWDVLSMLRVAVSRGKPAAEIRLIVSVHNDRHGPRPIELKAVYDQRMLTVMLPHED